MPRLCNAPSPLRPIPVTSYLPPDRRRAPGALAIWAPAAVVATLLGLASATFVYFGMMSASHPVTFATAIREGLTDWYFWVLAAPAVFAVARRFRIDRRRWIAVACGHLVLGSLVALVAIGVGVSFAQWVAPESGMTLWTLYHRTVLRNFHYAFMIYWMLVAAAHAYLYWQESQEAAALRDQLTRAQLESLRMQLQPHFLFNTLHTISTLVRARETDTAVGMLVGVADLLRSSLAEGSNETSLEEELGRLQAYLDIERFRFRDRLRVSIEIPPETLAAQVPSLILQPLVENAIRHGVERRMHASRIDVRAHRAAGSLTLEVQDDGPGFDSPDPAAGHGIGLRNTRVRLARLYGEASRLETGNLAGHGAFVRVLIPWHTEALDAGAAPA